MVYHGRVQDGRIVLEGNVRLPDGLRVRIDVPANADPAQRNGDAAAAPSTVWDRLLELSGTLEGLPPDASENLDHYLYDAPES